MNDILIRPIGFVKNKRLEKLDKNWSTIESQIELAPDFGY